MLTFILLLLVKVVAVFIYYMDMTYKRYMKLSEICPKMEQKLANFGLNCMK